MGRYEAGVVSNRTWETGTWTGRDNRGKRKWDLLSGFQNQPAMYAIVTFGAARCLGRGEGLGEGRVGLGVSPWVPVVQILWDLQVKRKEGQQAQKSSSEEKRLWRYRSGSQHRCWHMDSGRVRNILESSSKKFGSFFTKILKIIRAEVGMTPWLEQARISLPSW